MSNWNLPQLVAEGLCCLTVTGKEGVTVLADFRGCLGGLRAAAAVGLPLGFVWVFHLRTSRANTKVLSRWVT